jgi:hypothetical protein
MPGGGAQAKDDPPTLARPHSEAWQLIQPHRTGSGDM